MEGNEWKKNGKVCRIHNAQGSQWQLLWAPLLHRNGAALKTPWHHAVTSCCGLGPHHKHSELTCKFPWLDKKAAAADGVNAPAFTPTQAQQRGISSWSEKIDLVAVKLFIIVTVAPAYQAKYGRLYSWYCKSAQICGTLSTWLKSWSENCP